MDQKRIGKMIAESRKNKKLTQQELAEQLGVTDRSISNWENGKNMPDYSLLPQLSKILDVSLNDLLSGEKVDGDNSQNKSEEKDINLIKYKRDKAFRKYKIRGIIILVIGIIISFSAISIFSSESSWGSIYSVMGVVLSMSGFGLLIKKLSFIKRLALLFIYFNLVFGLLFILDYLNVELNNVAPRFAINIVTVDTTVMYDTIFYDVYRCNTNQPNETFTVTNNSKYSQKSISNFCIQDEIIAKENKEKILSCLEKELGNYITTEKDMLKSISLDEITDKKDKISYYKGFANNDNMYIMYEGNFTYEWDVMRDFDLYFSQKFPTYQKFLFSNSGIYVLIHNTSKNIDYEELLNKCDITDNNNAKTKKIPSKTLKKLTKTNKIIIKSNDGKLGTINDKKVINEVVDIISGSIQYYGKNIGYLCDGNAFNFELYNDKDELIDTILLWYDGKRLIPKSLSGKCSYYLITKDLREIIERETNYKFYGITDYSESCDTALELIYEDSEYKYYLNCIKSDKVLISFTLNNTTMTLKYALNNNYISIEHLFRYNEILMNELLIKKKK